MDDGNLGDPRETLGQLAAELERQLGSELVALYLFGSLAAGGFYPGKSDLDLMAIVETEVREGEQLDALREVHGAFVGDRPEWVERIEVAYVDRRVLQTFGERPAGRIAVISPGEPLHLREAGFEATLDWHSVTTQGETILGPQPLALGPTVSQRAYRAAVEALLREWPSRVRTPWVAYVPAHQGYVVVTLCRALHALATGRQTTKEAAAAWACARYPEWSSYIQEALDKYRSDVRSAHDALISFTDHAVGEADGLTRGPVA
jgi:predicted nucleotidyltransferase